MKITFKVEKPLRNGPSLMDLKQSAQSWFGSLMEAAGDQMDGGGEGRIGIEIEGVEIEFRVLTIPGVFETHRIPIQPPNTY